MTPGLRDLVAALAAFVLGVLAVRTLGQMLAGHAVHLIRRHIPRKKHRRR